MKRSVESQKCLSQTSLFHHFYTKVTEVDKIEILRLKNLEDPVRSFSIEPLRSSRDADGAHHVFNTCICKPIHMLGCLTSKSKIVVGQRSEASLVTENRFYEWCNASVTCCRLSSLQVDKRENVCTPYNVLSKIRQYRQGRICFTQKLTIRPVQVWNVLLSRTGVLMLFVSFFRSCGRILNLYCTVSGKNIPYFFKRERIRIDISDQYLKPTANICKVIDVRTCYYTYNFRFSIKPKIVVFISIIRYEKNDPSGPRIFP